MDDLHRAALAPGSRAGSRNIPIKLLRRQQAVYPPGCSIAKNPLLAQGVSEKFFRKASYLPIAACTAPAMVSCTTSENPLPWSSTFGAGGTGGAGGCADCTRIGMAGGAPAPRIA